MTIKLNEISKQFSYLAILFFLIRASFFDKVVFTYLGILFGLIVFFLQISRLTVYRNIFFFLILTISISLFTFINNGFDRGLIFLPFVISSIGIAWSIYENGLNHKFTLAIFYSLASYYLLKVFYFGYYPDDIFSNSRNHVSAMFISLFSLIVISSNINKTNINLIHCIVLLICCFSAIGISGIFVSSFIFITFFQYKYFNFTTKHFSVSVIFTLTLFLSIIFFWPYIEMYIILKFQPETDIAIKFGRVLSDILKDNSRILILNEYLFGLDTKKLIFGSNLDMELLDLNNFHNAFLVLHARAGILILVFFGFLIYALVKNFYKDFMLSICLLAIVLRSMTDTTLFSGYHYEYIFIYLLLFSYKERFKNIT